jgi:hypothetical protein
MSQQYYILKPAVGTKETGMAYPAVESFEDYDFNAPNSVHKIQFNEFPDFTPDIRFKLAKGAKLCDMMGQATINANGFLISEKLKAIFESSNTIPCKFYSATIENKGTIHQYYWVHFIWEEGKQLIDFPNSVFFKRKFSNNLGYLDIKSNEDIQNTLNEYQGRYMIGFEYLKLKEQPSFELMIVPFKTDIFVSENLKSLLSTFTGIDYELLKNVDFTALN